LEFDHSFYQPIGMHVTDLISVLQFSLDTGKVEKEMIRF